MFTNVNQNVVTYAKSSLGLLQNYMVFASNMNTEYKEFNITRAGNLGDTTSFDLPPRFTSNDSLVVNNFDSYEMRVKTLTVDQQANVNMAYSDPQKIFNLDPIEYQERFGESMMIELANKIESNIAGAILTNTYRFFGVGAPINSYNQLALANAYFKNYGMAMGKTKAFVDDIAVAEIIATGLNQFVPSRNDEIANSWELGTFDQTEYFRTNLLPVHDAGTLGDAGTVLTVVSTNDPTGQSITQITFSGAGTDSNAIKENDLLYFLDGVAGQPNMRFLKFTGYTVSRNPVQVRCTADASSSGGNVTVSIYPPLQYTVGKNQNLNNMIVAGMQAKIVPSHRRGLLLGGNAFYLGMPRLPEEVPYPTGTVVDEESKIGLRMYYGSIFGKAERGVIYDAIWGKALVDEYAYGLIFPL